VPERKSRSGMILDFGLKKETNFSGFGIFEVFVQTLLRNRA
jgi:hypothetical protein